MKCILHIGTEKTGTTSLQHWMHQNDMALRGQGVQYSECLGRPNNTILHLIAAKTYIPNEQSAYRKVFSQSDLDALRDTATRQIKAEVAGGGGSTYLISNEHLQSRLYDPIEITFVRDFLLEVFSEVEVICFMRPQAEALLSRLSTRARVGGRITAGAVTGIAQPFYDYDGLYHRWSEVFGPITIVPFSRNKDVVQYFCDRLALDKTDFKPVPRTNSALDYRTIAFKNALNLQGYENGKLNHNRRDFADELPVSEPLSFGKSEIEAINAKVLAGNERLVAACGSITLADLSPNLDKYPEVGNIEALNTTTLFDDRLGTIIMRLNVEVWLERTRTKQVMAKMAISRGNGENAGKTLRAAKRYLGYAAEPKFEHTLEDIKKLRRAQRRIEKDLDELHGLD